MIDKTIQGTPNGANINGLADPAGLPLFLHRGAVPQARRLAGGQAQPPAPRAVPGARGGGARTPARPAQPPPARPAQPSAPVPELAGGPVDAQDWTLVRQLRTLVSERIQEWPGRTIRLDRSQDEDLARSLADDEIIKLSQRRSLAGEPPLPESERSRLCDAVLDAIFGLGRMEALLSLPGLEDLVVRGCDNVWLYFGDGRKVRGPAVADSDEELIADLAHLGANAPNGERAFSPASRTLDLALAGGHRLVAGAWFTPRPYVTIRVHGLRDADLDDMVDRGMIDQTLRLFLSAAIRAGMSIVFSGMPGTGKTSLMRATLHELPPSTALATIETRYELWLHEMPGRHDIVWPAEAQPGGEGGVGRMTCEELVEVALSQTVDRIIVGEVHGAEILAMFDAMTAAQGSVSTIHATSALDTVERMVTCAVKAPHVSTEFAYRQVAHHIDLIVNLDVIDESDWGGRKHRFVAEVMALHSSADQQDKTGVGHNALFERGPDGRAVPTGNRPSWIDKLERVGFDPELLTRGAATWTGPIPTLANTGKPQP